MSQKTIKIAALTLILSMFYSVSTLAQTGSASVNQDRDIDKLIALKKEVNRTHIKYRIQVFNGNRAGAEKAQKEFRNTFSEWRTKMTYEPPYYRIYVGNFKTRLEADRALKRIKKEFNSAFIIKPKNDK